MQTPILRLEQVDKTFRNHGTQHVLKRISFEVFPGEVVCLVGPSGSGKSTLLRTVNALETIDSGEIEVCGIRYRQTKLPMHEIRRNTAMIFQRFELFPHFTALQNVELAISLILKKDPQAARQEAQDLLEKVGLGEHARKYPKSLSGGQQQRVAIARALAVHPKILLCDEPTSALDPELVSEVLDILSAIARNGMTMLIVTHELWFAKRIATRCIFLDQGELVEAGPTREFFESPKSPRLKTFLSRVQHA